MAAVGATECHEHGTPLHPCVCVHELCCLHGAAGGFTGSALGAGLTSLLGVTSSDFSNLFLLVLLCTSSTLLPAPFLWLLPKELDQDPPTDSGKAAAAQQGDTATAPAAGAAGSGAADYSRRKRYGASVARGDSIELTIQLPGDATSSANGSSTETAADSTSR